MIFLNWMLIAHTLSGWQHWAGWVCAKFSWNLLRFGCEHYSNTLFYMSVCLCFATHNGHWASSSLWFTLTSQRQSPRVREKQHVGEKHVKQSQYTVSIVTDKQNITLIDTWNFWVFVAKTVCTRAECLWENDKASKKKLSGVSLCKMLNKI